MGNKYRGRGNRQRKQTPATYTNVYHGIYDIATAIQFDGPNSCMYVASPGGGSAEQVTESPMHYDLAEIREIARMLRGWVKTMPHSNKKNGFTLIDDDNTTVVAHHGVSAENGADFVELVDTSGEGQRNWTFMMGDVERLLDDMEIFSGLRQTNMVAPATSTQPLTDLLHRPRKAR